MIPGLTRAWAWGSAPTGKFGAYCSVYLEQPVPATMSLVEVHLANQLVTRANGRGFSLSALWVRWAPVRVQAVIQAPPYPSAN